MYFAGVGEYPEVRNSIFWANTKSGAINSINAGNANTSSETVFLTIEYTLLPAYSVGLNPTSEVLWGDGIQNSAPVFASGPDGSYYLSQTEAGQAENSPAVNTGKGEAATTCDQDGV